MEINRLNAEELGYEMEARGLNKATVEVMRKMLRATLRQERRGSIDSFSNYPFEFAEDEKEVLGKMQEIRELLGKVEEGGKSGEYLKAVAKVQWALGRVDRARPEDKDQVASQRVLKSELMGLLVELDEKAGVDADDEEQEDAAGSKMETRPPIRRSVAMEDEEAGPSRAGAAPQRTMMSLFSQPTEELRQEIARELAEVANRPSQWTGATSAAEKPENLSKWDLKFSGEKGALSLHSFLERVEVLKLARGVSDGQLLRGAADLFSDQALVWFRANRPYFTTWATVVEELKAEFYAKSVVERKYRV